LFVSSDEDVDCGLGLSGLAYKSTRSHRQSVVYAAACVSLQMTSAVTVDIAD